MGESDSSSISEDSLLDNVRNKTPPVASKPTTQDHIDIPSIFLVEGEKNRKLLQQNEEIQNRIVEDRRRAQEKKETVQRLQQTVLDELNDNGSDYLFTLRNDRVIIEKYIEQIQGNDPYLVLDRHFFYFRNCPKVTTSCSMSSTSFPIDPSPLLRSLLLLVQDSLQHCRNVLEEQNLDVQVLVSNVLKYATDPLVFRLAERFLAETHGNETNADHSKDEEHFLQLMDGIGACDVRQLVLKLIQFNNNVDILIDRLSLVFQYSIRNLEVNFDVLLREFILSSSDYHLNKRFKSKLVETFMAPVFCSLVDKYGKPFSDDLETDLKYSQYSSTIHNVLVQLKTRRYDESEEYAERAWEHHYTFLENLLSRKQLLTKQAQSILNELICLFLQLEEPLSELLQPLYKILREISLAMKFTGFKLAIKCMYCFKVVVSTMSDKLIEWDKYGKKEFLDFYQLLLDAKNGILKALGSLQLTIVGIRERHRISAALRELYHDLDYFSVVLDKNIILMRQNEFYEE